MPADLVLKPHTISTLKSLSSLLDPDPDPYVDDRMLIPSYIICLIYYILRNNFMV
jgi:hypothetical protein